MAVASACAAPTHLTDDTHIQVHSVEALEYALDSIAQVEDRIPFQITAGLGEGHGWDVYLVPCDTYIRHNETVCDGDSDAVTDYAQRTTWIDERQTGDKLRALVAHELGHVFGIVEHRENGVMASPSREWIYTDTELETIERIYQ